MNSTRPNPRKQRTDPENLNRLVYTPTEAAHALRISRSNLYRLLSAGEIPSILIGNRRRIPARALDAMIERTIDSAAAAGLGGAPGH